MADPTSSYYSQQPDRFRGSSYPSFAGGSVDQSGNVVQTPQVTNVSSHTPTQAVQTPDTIAAGGIDAVGKAGNPNTGLAGQFPQGDGSTAPKSLGGQIAATAAQTVLPAAGSSFGAAAGNAIAGGSSFGGAINAGGKAVGNLLDSPLSSVSDSFGAIGNGLSKAADAVGGFLGGGGSAAGSASVAPLSLTPVSELSGGVTSTTAGSAVGSLGGASAAASALGGFGAGIGTFAADLISGKSLAKSGIDAAATGIGAAIGSYVIPIPVVGTVIGGLLGGFVGSLFGPRPSVGPNGQTDFLANTSTGHLDLGPSGADNGADVNVTLGAATTTQKAINDYLDTNHLAVTGKDPNYVGSDGWKRMLSIGQGAAYEGPARTAQDVWQYMVKNNMVGAKPGYEAGNPAPGVNQQTQSISGLNGQFPSDNPQVAALNKARGLLAVSP